MRATRAFVSPDGCEWESLGRSGAGIDRFGGERIVDTHRGFTTAGKRGSTILNVRFAYAKEAPDPLRSIEGDIWLLCEVEGSYWRAIGVVRIVRAGRESEDMILTSFEMVCGGLTQVDAKDYCLPNGS